jgi:tetratricopeptide (TPR) repeat protein
MIKASFAFSLRGIHGIRAGVEPLRSRVTTLLACLGIASFAPDPANSACLPYSFSTSAFPKYKMTITIDPPAHRLTVGGSISVPAPLVHDGTVVIALSKAAMPARFSIRGSANAVPIERKPADTAPDELSRWLLKIPEGSFKQTLELEFSLEIKDSTTTIFAITPAGSFGSGSGTAWYPQIVDAENVRMLGIGQLDFRTDHDSVVISTGLNPAKAETKAGSAKVFPVSTPHYFDFAAGPYHRIKSRSGGTELFLLGSHPNERRFADELDSTIKTLVEEFGPFPEPRFALVEVPGDAAQKAGFEGASLGGLMLVIPSYFDKPFNVPLFGHELSHQWWGGTIRRKGDRGQYLLDEALAQYGSLRAVEKLQGEDAAEQYRRRGAPGYYSEYSGFGYLARSLVGIDAPLDNLPASDGFLSRRVANTKGMLVWSMLAHAIGHKAFNQFLKAYVKEHAYDRVTLDNFLGALRKAAGTKSWFIDQWFFRTGAPDLKLSWKREDRGVKIVIEQPPDNVYQATLPVAVIGPAGQRFVTNVNVAGPLTEVHVPSKFVVEDVLLDPKFEILRWTPEYRAEAKAIIEHTKGDVVLNNGKNDEAIAVFRRALETAAEPDRYGLKFRLHRGLGDALAGKNETVAAVAQYQAALNEPARPEEQIPEVLFSLSDLYYKLGDAGAERDARARAVAVINALSAAPVARDTKKN